MSINYKIGSGHKYAKNRTMKTINFILFITLFSLNSFAQVVLADDNQLAFNDNSKNTQEVIQDNITVDVTETEEVINDELVIQLNPITGKADVYLYSSEGALLGSGNINIDDSVQLANIETDTDLNSWVEVLKQK